MRQRLSLALALGMVMLMSATAAAHGRAFVRGRVGVFAHPITVARPMVGVSPGFVTVSPFRNVPQAAFVIAPPGAIRRGTPVIVHNASSMFFPQTVLVSPPLQGTFPLRVTVPSRSVVPRVIMVVTPGSTRKR
jgi:hypothetical protein